MKVNYLPSDPPGKSWTPEKTPSTLLIRDQVANICWIIKKAREFQKDIYFCFIDYAKAFDFLKEMGIPEHLTRLWETCMQLRKQHLELDMEKQTGSK